MKDFLSRVVTGHEIWTESLCTASWKTIDGVASSSFSLVEVEGYPFKRESRGQFFWNAEDLTLIDIRN